MSRTPVLKVDDLKVWFPQQKGILKKTVGHVKAVDGVSFEIYKGETFGLVGESGCGKTSVGKAIVRLNPITHGSVELHGTNIANLSMKEMREFRSVVQMIFQDPFSSLNPRMTVGDIIGEAVRFYRPNSDIHAEIVSYMEQAGLRKEYLQRYPHQFSGGQRQRIGIARALACQPEIIVADEPVSALDVSIQAQIINLLKSLQRDLGLSFLFIAHDLSVVKHISDRVGVMYLGNIVEISPSKELDRNPLHPYTQALIGSVPVTHPSQRRSRQPLTGEVPSPMETFTGCKFCKRCPVATDKCRSEIPVLREAEPEHWVACHQVEIS
ncbi:ATP-binding cassette domain-containing protein [Vibrio sp. JC009]|uniref:ABC transporter ATP-binding protein n=1 Tax=Vibrio sp. JC009 TaxID=2912314 RepID=UPI0023B0060E|nr:oligopeptide/dipeptide ABC transporter ATP-binding protein [Vibrio sp. JC009]WED22846.1 ATP-binding cassette domain-containing protein [Vibrio sp. JC009]